MQNLTKRFIEQTEKALVADAARESLHTRVVTYLRTAAPKMAARASSQGVAW